MKFKRYYINKQLTEGQNIVLDGDEFHHMVNVMRTRIGEEVELFCGDGNNYVAVVDEIQKKQAILSIKSMSKNMCEPQIKLDVYQALAKGDKLNLITQKITELGASSLFVFDSKFCDVKANTGKLDRLESVSSSASKQCGRSSILDIQGVLNINQVCQNIAKYDKFFVFYEAQEEDNFKNHLLELQNKNVQKIAIMIGAEGGFAPEEIEKLTKSGATIVGLGKRILRTETASIIGTALVMQMLEN